MISCFQPLPPSCPRFISGFSHLTAPFYGTISAAPNAPVGEIEILTPERTYRLRVGRDKPGTKPIQDRLKAAQTWVTCLNMATVAALGQAEAEAEGAAGGAFDLRASLVARASMRASVKTAGGTAVGGLEPAAEGEEGEEEDPLGRAMQRTQQSARDLASMM